MKDAVLIKSFTNGKLFLHMLECLNKVFVRGFIMTDDTGDPDITVFPNGIQNTNLLHFTDFTSLHGQCHGGRSEEILCLGEFHCKFLQDFLQGSIFSH